MGQLYIPGTASSGDVLTGKSFSAGTNYQAAGTMPNNGSLGTITPGTSAKSIPAGYTSGGTVAGDADLVAANILSGKSIFGVAGSAVRGYYSDGIATISTGGTFTLESSQGYVCDYITVSGLGFEPDFIRMGDFGNPFLIITIYTNKYVSNNSRTISLTAQANNGLVSSVMFKSSGDLYVNNGSFRLPIMGHASNSIGWNAYKSSK